MEPTVLHLAGRLLCRERQEEARLTLRIYRSSTPDAIVFALSGDMDLEHVARLQELLASETVNRLTLDLKEVTFADRAAVQFLASAEASGIRIVNCPRYVRSWITAEAENQPQRIEEQDK
jgi:ABC-type transporter Mla MlaB component